MFFTENYGIEKAMVFCNDNIKTESGICYMPIYMLMFLEQEQQELGTYKINLDG